MTDQKPGQVLASASHLNRMKKLLNKVHDEVNSNTKILKYLSQSDVDAAKFYVFEAQIWLLEAHGISFTHEVSPRAQPIPPPAPPKPDTRGDRGRVVPLQVLGDIAGKGERLGFG